VNGACQALVEVNYVYIKKDIKQHPVGLCRVNWRMNYKSDLYGPGGFSVEYFVSELIMDSP
jgi:hypothetical protein